MKLLVSLILLLSLNFHSGFAKEGDWKESRSTHFIVYYNNAPQRFIEQLVSKAEDYYNNIANDLGFRRYDFWLWERRAKIYIYDNAKEYISKTGQAPWSAGSVLPKDKVIQSFVNQENFFQTILPHEMGHIIFREFVGFNNSAVPVWLDEGVASYQEVPRRKIASLVVKEAAKKGELIPLGKLAQLDPQSMPDERLISLFYAQSLNIIEYLVREFGKDNFVFFCQALRDKKDLDKALSYAYAFRNIQELDKAWQRYLE